MFRFFMSLIFFIPVPAPCHVEFGGNSTVIIIIIFSDNIFFLSSGSITEIVTTSRIHAENCYLRHNLAQLQNLFLFQQGSICDHFRTLQLDMKLPISQTLFHLHCLDILHLCNYSALPLSFRTEMESELWAGSKNRTKVSKSEQLHYSKICLIRILPLPNS